MKRILNAGLQPKGFTLVELLVVISIIGILTGIIVSGLDGAKKSSRDTRRIADIKSLQLALSQYYNDNGFYPASMSATYDPVTGGITPSDGLVPVYITTIPTDPQGNAYKYSSYRADGSASCATTANPPVRYHLAIVMENQVVANNNSDYYAGSATACGGSTTKFHGVSTACSGTTQVTPDYCYDVIPN